MTLADAEALKSLAIWFGLIYMGALMVAAPVALVWWFIFAPENGDQ